MRRLDVREWGLSEEITQLVLPLSNGTPPILYLHLQKLDWWLNETNLSFLPKFLSPNLTEITIDTNAATRPEETVKPWVGLPDEIFPMMRSAIRAFPSSLRRLHIVLGTGPLTHLTEEISAFILERGETLREFSSNSMLSIQAIVHLMKLPHLSEWTTEQGPPEVTELIRHGAPDGAVSLFPSLKVLGLRGEGLEWLSLFEPAKSRTPWTMAGNGLSILGCHHPTLPIDSSLISRHLPFTSLINVKIGMKCLFQRCASRFTDQDAERLAIALPELETLSLCERPCDANTCPTTIRSLLSFSIHCLKLRYLSIHFRTANIQADVLDMLSYAHSQGLHLRPKSGLKVLATGGMYVELSDHDPALISMGMLMIFPSLDEFVKRPPTHSRSSAWSRLEVLMEAFRLTGMAANFTEKFMMHFNGARESDENEVPVRSAVSLHPSFGLTSEGGYVCLFINVTLCSFLQEEIVSIICGRSR